MIISHKYKFLFIGLPFSASSAISKELNLEYQAEPFLRKHSLYHEFKKIATKKELSYFVFAVLRNPMEIALTVYEKMRANAKGNFTNPELFSENGGHITKEHRKRFNFIHDKKATFQQYFKKFYQKPYDNLSSLTIDNCDYVIRYENIKENYLTALKKAGITNPRPLPVANKTAGKKKDILKYYTEEIKEQAIFVFGPFLEKYNYSFPEKWGKVRVPLKSKLYFKLLSVLRKINHRYFKKHTNKNSLKGTIYGDMQRKQVKKRG
tara:strand:+ start:352 stop:1143 length:792 start_codon:yes stop_codon:yes gene_type:complete